MSDKYAALEKGCKYEIPSLPKKVSAEDIRETLNVPMFEDEAQAAANGFNQCLLECGPIGEAAKRMSLGIDECLKEIDAMQENINYKHKKILTLKEHAEKAEKRILELLAERDADKARIADQREVMRQAAADIAYAIFNLTGADISRLSPGVVESTDPTDTALIAERNLRAAAGISLKIEGE